MENKELIGKKILGFKFRDRVGIKYNDCMGTCVGKIGIIRKYDEKHHSYSVKFSDGEIWFYPAELIEQHIVEANEMIQEPQEPNKIYTIQDLKEGKCILVNDGTLNELKKVWAKVLNRKLHIYGDYKYYLVKDGFVDCHKHYLLPNNIKHLPKQSVKEFLNQIELGSQGQNVLDNATDFQEPNTIEGIKDCQGNVVDMKTNPFSLTTMEMQIMREFDEMRIIYSTETPTEGIKESDNKINIEYDWDFLKAQMNRMAKNKHKYPKNNWKKPMDIEQLKDALFRHVLEVMDNKFEDDGDEFGHLSAIALNAMMINYQLKNK